MPVKERKYINQTPEIWGLIDRLAKDEFRSVHSLIEMAVRHYAKSKEVQTVKRF